MGIISSTVLNHGGSVTGIVPAAMLRAGGEGEPTTGGHIDLVEEGNKKVRLFHKCPRRSTLRQSETSLSRLNLGQLRTFFIVSVALVTRVSDAWIGCRIFHARAQGGNGAPSFWVYRSSRGLWHV
jgi:hypothetical protein